MKRVAIFLDKRTPKLICATFSYFRKLVKITVKLDRQHWLSRLMTSLELCAVIFGNILPYLKNKIISFGSK
jgi:hypothetical protein